MKKSRMLAVAGLLIFGLMTSACGTVTGAAVGAGAGAAIGAGTGHGAGKDRKSTRLNSSHIQKSRMPSSA